MMMFFASISCASPSFGLIETFPGAVMVPRPAKVVTLFSFINRAHAAGERLHDLIFARQHGGQV